MACKSREIEAKNKKHQILFTISMNFEWIPWDLRFTIYGFTDLRISFNVTQFTIDECTYLCCTIITTISMAMVALQQLYVQCTCRIGVSRLYSDCVRVCAMCARLVTRQSQESFSLAYCLFTSPCTCLLLQPLLEDLSVLLYQSRMFQRILILFIQQVLQKLWNRIRSNFYNTQDSSKLNITTTSVQLQNILQ